MKKNNKKGFTLAELLIVVAIIAVLVAIAIPVFTAQLNRAKYASDLANARSIYAELTADYLANGGTPKVTITGLPTSATNAKQTVTVTNSGTTPATTNSYSFSGIVVVRYTAGTASAAPTVTVEACATTGDAQVVFGATTSGGDTTGD